MLQSLYLLNTKFFKTLGLSLILSMYGYTVSAQSQYLQVYGGASSTNIVSKNYPFEDSKNRIGFMGGVNYIYVFETGLYVGVGMMYNQRGYVFDIPSSDKTREANFDYDYLSSPIKLGYTIGEKLKGFGSIGVLPSFLLETIHTFPVFDNQTSDFTGYESFDRTDVTRKFDFGAIIEAGAGYQLSNQWLIFTSLAYNRSFTNSTTDDFASTSEVRHYGVTLSLGVMVSLN